MGTINLPYKRVKLKDGTHNALAPDDFARFNENLLDLGDISREADPLSVVAAVFDLQGFTAFCNQDDPRLVVPEFLDRFLRWLFESIKTEFKKEEKDGDTILWGGLPFFGKFMGDGVLFLWEAKSSGSKVGLGNIVVSASDITDAYAKDFYPSAHAAYSKVPKVLRAGLARGDILSIGGGKDYVGPCINLAARLQKIGSLPFAFSRKGLDPKKCFAPQMRKKFVTIEAEIHGLEEGERVIVFESDYLKLPKEEKEKFPIIERHN